MSTHLNVRARSNGRYAVTNPVGETMKTGKDALACAYAWHEPKDGQG